MPPAVREEGAGARTAGPRGCSAHPRGSLHTLAAASGAWGAARGLRAAAQVIGTAIPQTRESPGFLGLVYVNA